MEVAATHGQNLPRDEYPKRVLIYVHFNKNDTVDDYVLHQLEEMKRFYSKIIILSNSHISGTSMSRLGKYTEDLIQRVNVGFDFAAWRDGISHMGWDVLSEYDELTIMNDTCFGPIRDMSSVFDRFSNDVSVDFWGITNHRKEPHGMPGTFTNENPLGDPIPEYIQTYFSTFKKNVMRSKIFQNFWEGIENLTDIKQVIVNYETQLTKVLTEAGYRSGVLVEATTIEMPEYAPFHNVCLWTPDILLPLSPFVKRKSFVRNRYTAQLVFSNFEKINYPLAHITDYVKSIDSGNRQMDNEDRLIVLRGNSGSGKSTIANRLKSELFYGVMVVGWDSIRIDMFNRFDYINRDKYIFDTLKSLCDYGRRNNLTVIIEGIYPSKTYKNILTEISAEFSKKYFYYLNISFQESLRRHDTREQRSAFGVNEMKKWYIPSDRLKLSGEKTINDKMSEEAIIKMILNDIQNAKVK